MAGHGRRRSQPPARGLRVERGALLAEVVPDSPAAKAGLRAGDTVVAMDGRPICSAEDLTSAVAAKQPGDELELEVVREGEERKVRVELGVQPARAPSQ